MTRPKVVLAFGATVPIKKCVASNARICVGTENELQGQKHAKFTQGSLSSFAESAGSFGSKHGEGVSLAEFCY